jgi:hypothetical protein
MSEKKKDIVQIKNPRTDGPCQGVRKPWRGR